MWSWMSWLTHSQVKEALQAAWPLKPAMNRKPNPWWNNELEKSRSKVRLLRENRHTANPFPKNFMLYPHEQVGPHKAPLINIVYPLKWVFPKYFWTWGPTLKIMPFPHLLTASRSVGIPINCMFLDNKLSGTIMWKFVGRAPIFLLGDLQNILGDEHFNHYGFHSHDFSLKMFMGKLDQYF